MGANAIEIQLTELKDLISKQNTLLGNQSKQIDTLQRLVESLTEEKDKAIAERDRMQEERDYFQRKYFGTSSEKRAYDIPGQINLFNEAEQEADPAVADLEFPETVTVKEHTRKAKKKDCERYKGLKVEVLDHPLPDDQLICQKCGTKLEVVGHEFIRREVVFIPATAKIIEHYAVTYKCPECDKQNEHSSFLKGPVPEALMPHSQAASSCVAWAIKQKFYSGVPIYRQVPDWKQYGIDVTRSTIANWIIRCTEAYFRPMFGLFHRRLILRTFCMADETRVQVLNEPGRRPETDSFMWLFRSGEDGLPPIILYLYEPTRNGDNAAEFLEGFSGYLMTDGFQGYNKVRGVKRCSCWAHARRYMIDAVPKGKTYDYSNPAVQGVSYCSKLFALEEKISVRAKDYEERKALRLQEEKPVLEAFWAWLEQQQPTKGTRLDKAVQYIRNRKDSLSTYLEDGRCSFSNNASENAIRPFTVGRKNWLFSASVNGAEASAMAYTMVEMAKAYDLNVYGYLEFLLDSRPSASMEDSELERFAPWNPEVQKQLKN